MASPNGSQVHFQGHRSPLPLSRECSRCLRPGGQDTCLQVWEGVGLAAPWPLASGCGLAPAPKCKGLLTAFLFPKVA